jgi:hypothetical protein
MKRATSESLHGQLLDMKLEIGQMKRTLSNKKATIESRRNNSKEKRMYPATERKREKVYVPIISNRFFASPSDLHRPHALSEYQTPSLYPRTSQHMNSQEFRHATNVANISGYHSNKGSSGGRSKDGMPVPPSSRKHPSDGNVPNVLELIQEKLRIGILNEKSLFSSQSKRSETRQNPEIPMSNKPSIFQLLAPTVTQDMVQQNYNVNIRHTNGSSKKEGSAKK